MTIWFDMDGTIADLYNVPNWLEYLKQEDTVPYETARPLCNFEVVSELCKALQNNGIKIGIISWTSKNGSPEYNRKVRAVKRKWLKDNFKLNLDSIHIVKYGTPKHKFRKMGDLLIDDDSNVRNDWGGLTAYNPNNNSIEKILENIFYTI